MNLVPLLPRRLIGMCILAPFVIPGRVPAAEPVDVRSVTRLLTVLLHDGHRVSGFVDSQTDARRLWLRREERGIDLTTGWEWSKVQQIQTAEGDVDLLRFRQSVQARATKGRSFADLTADHETRASRRVPSPPPRRVQSLLVDAELAQWDDDVQPDGLLVFVLPLDSAGRIVPVGGNLDLTLIGQRQPDQPPPSSRLTPRFPELERTSHIVRPADFAAGPAVYRLPFARVHPDFDLQLAHGGLLHARLGVTGQGVWEASDSNVCLRELSLFRDELQYYSRGRYLPIESGGQPNR